MVPSKYLLALSWCWLFVANLPTAEVAFVSPPLCTPTHHAQSTFVYPSAPSKQFPIVVAAESNPGVEETASGDDGDNENSGTEQQQDEEQSPPMMLPNKPIELDAKGADLTDRFKYKWNALKGKYDPVPGATDDESQQGNIFNAMMQFPTRFTFTVVGRTSGDQELKEKYEEKAKEIVRSLSGDPDGLECRVTQRGKSFTRLSMSALVDSVAIVNSVYEALDEMEMTVMRY